MGGHQHHFRQNTIRPPIRLGGALGVANGKALSVYWTRMGIQIANDVQSGRVRPGRRGRPCPPRVSWSAVSAPGVVVGRVRPGCCGRPCPPWVSWSAVSALGVVVGRVRPGCCGRPCPPWVSWSDVSALGVVVGRVRPGCRGRPCPPWVSWSAVSAPGVVVGRVRPGCCGRPCPPRAKAAGLINNALSRGLKKLARTLLSRPRPALLNSPAPLGPGGLALARFAYLS